MHKENKDSQDYYDSISSGYEELYGEEQREKQETLFSLFDSFSAYRSIIGKENTTSHKITKNGKRLKALDIGCGPAPYFDNIMSLLKGKGNSIIGIDPSEKLLEQCRYKEKYASFAEDLQFKDREFDLVFSVTAAQNFRNPDKAIREILRITDKGGIIGITFIDGCSNQEELVKKRKEAEILLNKKDKKERYIILRKK